VPALIPREWYAAEQARRQARAQKFSGAKVDAAFEPRRVAGYPGGNG